MGNREKRGAAASMHDRPPMRSDYQQRPHFSWIFDAYNDGEDFAAFDIETTGLNSSRDSIVEIGAIRFNRQGITGSYSQLIDPGVPMPAGAGSVNNITDTMLGGQPSIHEALPAFLDFSAGSVIMAHNAPFDCGFVNNSLSRLYDDGYVPFPALPNRVADTLPLARQLLPGRGRYGLQEIAADLGLKAEAAHRALDDARLCMELFLYLCKNLFH